MVVNNFRPGVMERMGFGYEACQALNPRIIYAIGTGFGLEGPYLHKGGQDILAQAMTGVMARKSHDPAIRLAIYATPLCDYSAGMHLVQGILLALLQREKTGEGQQVAVSLYSSMIAVQMQEAAMWMMRGKELNWAAMPLTGVFETTDGAMVMVGAFKQNPLRDICKALELPDLSAEERFADFDRPEGAPRRAAGDLPRPVPHQHHRPLADAAGGGRHPLRAGPLARRGAGRRADGDQPADPRSPGDRRRPGAAGRLADQDVGGAGRRPPAAAGARRRHGSDPRARCRSRGEAAE